MSFSGVYYIAITGNQADASIKILRAIVSGIESQFPFATRHEEEWKLFHRLLRYNPDPNGKAAEQQKLQHILHVSLIDPQRTYVYIDQAESAAAAARTEAKPEPNSNLKVEPVSQAPTPQPPQATPSASKSSLIAIPVTQSESHASLLVNQFGALWTLRYGHTIQGGTTYSAGQFTIHLGELRAIRAAQSGTVSAGVILCISTPTGSEDDSSPDDFTATEELEEQIRALWGTLKPGIDFGKSEVKACMMQDLTPDAAVKMWCGVLRSRG